MEGGQTDGAQKGRKRDEKSVFSGSSSRVRAGYARCSSSRAKKREAHLLFSPPRRSFSIFRVYLC